MKNSKQLGFSELNESELKNTSGGSVIMLFLLAGSFLAYYEKHLRPQEEA